MSESNTCIAEPNLEVLPLTKIMEKTSLFFFVLKNDVWSFDTLPLLYYQKTTNSAVNRSLASVVTEMISLNVFVN